MVCATCTIPRLVSTMEVKLIVVAERECSNIAWKSPNFPNKPHTQRNRLGTIHTNYKDIKVFGKASLDGLDKWPSLLLKIHSVFYSSSCIFVQRRKYLWWHYSRMEMQPGSHRLTDLRPFASKINTLLLLSFPYQTWGKKPKYWNLHSYCNRKKNDSFVSQSDLDPRVIDLTLYGNLPIQILYQYQYVAQSERLNNGIITTCLRNGSAYRCDITRKDKKAWTEMTSHEHE